MPLVSPFLYVGNVIATTPSDSHAEIAAELEKADEAFAQLLRVSDQLAALAEGRARPWWRRLRLRAV
jgi:hypothetical protein